jgi:hypothetical protein
MPIASSIGMLQHTVNGQGTKLDLQSAARQAGMLTGVPSKRVN